MTALVKDGKRMGIIRPDSPAFALALVDDIPDGTPHEIAQTLFESMLHAQPYTLMGFAADRQPYILNADGKVMGRVKEGDSYVDYDHPHTKTLPVYQWPMVKGD